MKYQEIINALSPYADQKVDAFVSEIEHSVSFWINDGEKELIIFDVHK